MEVRPRPKKYIYRYTSFASAVHLLSTKSITLLNPNSWDDRNDVYFMSRYKEREKAKSVYALCFSGANQTYHHWRVFSPGPDGVCISFDASELKKALESDTRNDFRKVEYKSLEELKHRSNSLSNDQLRFTKHIRYEPESKQRVVFTDLQKEVKFPCFPIKISSIERITLSPWLNKSLVAPMKGLLKKIYGCERLKVYRSTLINYRDWCSLAD